MMRAVVLVLSSIPLLLSCATSTAELEGKWVDLRHPFSEETVYWPTASGFEFTVDSKGMTPAGYWYEANSFRTAEHGGTHLDAPVHFAQGKHSAEQIPIEKLVGPTAVVDVSARALVDRDYRISVEDLRGWEALHGLIPDGAILLLHTGYGRYWPDREGVLGTSLRGPAAVAELHFPGLHPDAARWLVQERRVDAVGLDTPSIDYGQSTLFESHRVLFAENIPVFENVAGLDELPPKGALVFALPMKIEGGSGGPLRIVALLPH